MKHKHKFYPTNETIGHYSKSVGCAKATLTYLCHGIARKWVCECGKVKWVEEKG